MGNKIKQANAARQNAITKPGQPSNQGALAKNPLVLHNMAARTIIQRARTTAARLA